MSLTYPEDRSYHSEHLWAKSEPDGTMLVGITDYAQDQLGGVIFVDLPAVGEHFKQGVSCASIESVKITSDAIIPVSGEIVAVNEALADAPNCSTTALTTRVGSSASNPTMPTKAGAFPPPNTPRWLDRYIWEGRRNFLKKVSPPQTPPPPLQRLYVY